MMLMVLMMNMMILEKMRSTKDLVTGHLKILWLHTNVTLSIILMRTQLSKRHNYDIEYEDLGDDKDDDVDGLESWWPTSSCPGGDQATRSPSLPTWDTTSNHWDNFFNDFFSREEKSPQLLDPHCHPLQRRSSLQKMLTCLHPLCCVVWGQWCSGELGNMQRKKRDGQTIVRKKDKKLEKFWVGGDPVVLQWVGEKERDGQTIVCKRIFRWGQQWCTKQWLQTT